MTRDRIFDAAKAVLEKEGLPGLTMRKVAERAGISPMGLYRHFADKDALLNALTEDGLARWSEIAQAIRAQDPIRWLEQLQKAYIAFALEEPHRFDAAFFLPASEARRYPDDFLAGRSPVVAMAMLRIDQAKAEGRLINKPALEILLTIVAASQGMVSMYRAKRFSNDSQFKALYRKTMRNCFESFAATAPRSSR